MIFQEPTTVTGVPNVWAFAIACVTAVTTIATAVIAIMLNRKADDIHVLVNSNFEKMKSLVRLYRSQLLSAGIEPKKLRASETDLEMIALLEPNDPKAP